MSYADLFDRIPDDIVLAASSRPINVDSCTECLCGWVIREEIAKAVNIDADSVSPYDVLIAERMGLCGGVPASCAIRFGGNEDDWDDVFGDITMTEPSRAIETAWVNRLDKAVRRSR